MNTVSKGRNMKFSDYETSCRTLHEAAIKYAEDKGYSFDFYELCLVCPSGKKVKPKLYGNQRYPSYTINTGEGTKRLVTFHFHKFVAYQLYRDKTFVDGVQVRHLDANTLNLTKENIVLGTSQDNQFDKPIEARKSAASKARLSQGKRSVNCSISDEKVIELLKEYREIKGDLKIAPRGSVSNLALKYGITNRAAQGICGGHNFKDLQTQNN